MLSTAILEPIVFQTEVYYIMLQPKPLGPSGTSFNNPLATNFQTRRHQHRLQVLFSVRSVWGSFFKNVPLECVVIFGIKVDFRIGRRVVHRRVIKSFRLVQVRSHSFISSCSLGVCVCVLKTRERRQGASCEPWLIVWSKTIGDWTCSIETQPIR